MTFWWEKCPGHNEYEYQLKQKASERAKDILQLEIHFKSKGFYFYIYSQGLEVVNKPSFWIFQKLLGYQKPLLKS